MSFLGFSDSKNNNWAQTKADISSVTGPTKKIIRSLSNLEKISKARSPRLVCSTTMGTKLDATSKGWEDGIIREEEGE
jgi:hypothetical protein